MAFIEGCPHVRFGLYEGFTILLTRVFKWLQGEAPNTSSSKPIEVSVYNKMGA